MPIGDLIGWQATRRPHAPALTCEDQTLSWAALEQRTNRLARAVSAARRGRCLFATFMVLSVIPNTGAGLVAALRHQLGGKSGAPHGIVSALMLPHVLRWNLPAAIEPLAHAARSLGVAGDTTDSEAAALNLVEAFYEAAIAAWKLGATPQPISARLPLRERQEIVDLADPKLIVGAESGAFGEREVIEPGFEPAADISDAPLPSRTARHWKAPTSGGSTGRPKLIVSALPGESDPQAPRFYMEADRAHLVTGPLYHNGPFVFSMFALFAGNHVVIMPRFDALRTLECIEQYHIDYMMMVPTMMHRIWRLDEAVRRGFDLSSLRVLLHLAAPCPTWLKEAWIDWLGPERIHELYAGTEQQCITWITGTEWLAHRGSVGRPVAGRLKILNETGDEAPPGEVGEVYMMPDDGPGATYHYVGAEAKSIEGWETLGDLGWVDEEGYLYLADRQSDMILRGGANIYPAEVEAAIEAHPQVRSCAVIGLPDEEMGARIHAIVDAYEAIGDDELFAHLAERLVRYKIPESFEYVEEPLRGDDGKVRRAALRAARLDSH